ncbi:PH domain-containing protein [Bacillus sp. FJAT-50079]|uniref:PH domain-containing protein n=1 Tax=Bacillus sp. FJAT-50079 TaxID=2833577 RepID=UPI001BC9449F|nr:PH domain-containing protein [Bacillus sp. FJAT-50079]MBS4206480.1 PH domain-containing protein [Bacillus sp. FJAT-50079]
MFNPKRLHPITILLELLAVIRQVIVPVALYFIVFAMRDGKDQMIPIEGLMDWIRQYGPMIAIGVILLFSVGASVIKWVRYTYRVEDMELRIEHGLFIKKKRYIPFERIQSLDFSEGIFHRPFGLVKVKVETAGGAKESEAEMSAIKKEDALAIQQLINDAKANKNFTEELTIDKENKETILYKITGRQLLFFASTSGRAGVIISAVVAFGSQFEGLIPFEKIFKGMGELIRTGYLLLTFIVFILFLFAWIISVIITYLKYNDFTLRKVEEDLVITRGLLEKRTTTIPIKKIQAVKITESPFRQPFGYASVAVEYAGSSVEEEKADGMLMPVVKKKAVAAMLQDALPDYVFDLDFTRVPKRAKRRFYLIKMVQALIVTVALSVWLWPYGLIASLLIALSWVIGVLQYRSAGWNITNNQLVIRYRDIQQQTVYMRKNRIQSIKCSVNWFQKRADLATVTTAVMSGGMSSFSIKHVDANEAATMYEWYRPTSVYPENE